jgi:major type 1 subunit fimbrin (pilin)
MLKVSKKLVLILSATALSTAAMHTFAADGTITINGKVIDNTCTLTAESGPVQSTKGNVVVTLPTVKTSAFTAATVNTAQKKTDFQLKIVDSETNQECTSLDGIQGVLISTTSDNYLAANTTALLNTKDVDVGATGNKVNLQLLDNAKEIDFKNPQTVKHDAQGIIKLAAQYFQVEEDIAPQNVSAQVDYTMVYN